jgi:tRNA-dihydrouridine synthase
MMGHTTRHYRYLWRIISRHARLYTEMIPSSAIVQAYTQEAQRLLGKRLVTTTAKSCGMDDSISYYHHAECIRQVLERLQEERWEQPNCPSSPLEMLLREDTHHGKITLQLGGRDPHILAVAAAIGTAYQTTKLYKDNNKEPSSSSITSNLSAYSDINLNCGCPSTSVATGRRTGAALMLEPQHVVQCLNAMTESIMTLNPSTTLSVKHRLGVLDANMYHRHQQELQSTGRYSIEQEEDEAYRSCHDFVSQVLTSSQSSHHLSRIQVHARLALLGLDQNIDSCCENDHLQHSASSALWVVSQYNAHSSEGTVKINHQRVQYRAKQQARQATIDNRWIPPLHPDVVIRLANDFSSRLQVVTNGGIQTLEDVQQRTTHRKVHGAMVGRGAINHPCAFAGADTVLFGDMPDPDHYQSRRQVLEQYMGYCTAQEEELTATKDGDEGLSSFRKELIAPAFHLFVGEEGNVAYQRLLKRLISRAQRHSSTQMLQAAMALISDEALNKRIDDHVPWNRIRQEFHDTYGEATMKEAKRSGAMQRVVY